MKKQVSNNAIKRKRESKRVAKMAKAGLIVNGVEIPKGALPVNPSEQNPSGLSTKFYYKDIQYTCAGCGKEDVWTAQQQQKYFEVQKGNIYNEPKWCYQCHSKRIKNKKDKS